MAKARKCDICGSYYDIYFYDSLDASVKYPNRIQFYVNYLDIDDINKITTHRPKINPARTALAVLNNEFARYDVCPDCMNKITSTMRELHLKSKVKEEKTDETNN